MTNRIQTANHTACCAQKIASRVNAKYGWLLNVANDTILDDPVGIASEIGNDLGEWTADVFPVHIIY